MDDRNGAWRKINGVGSYKLDTDIYWPVDRLPAGFTGCGEKMDLVTCAPLIDHTKSSTYGHKK